MKILKMTYGSEKAHRAVIYDKPDGYRFAPEKIFEIIEHNDRNELLKIVASTYPEAMIHIGLKEIGSLSDV